MAKATTKGPGQMSATAASPGCTPHSHPPEGTGHLAEEGAPSSDTEPPSSCSTYGKVVLLTTSYRPGPLTSNASLVMGYFSRLEMTSSTATMFRICKTRTARHAPALLPIPTSSASLLYQESIEPCIVKVPAPHSFSPAQGTNMAPRAHPPFHVHAHPLMWLSHKQNS